MIVVGGEAIVDLVPAPTTGDGELGALLPRLGGGPYNIAVGIGRLAVPVALLSRISTDTLGDALLDRLRRSGVDTSMIQRGDEPTALAVVGIGADGSARYSFHVEGTADRLLTDPGPLPDSVDSLSLGSVAMALEPSASSYEAVLRREAERGRLTVLDPNVRPALIPDPAGYRARFLSWLPHVALLKVSVEDAQWLAGAAAEADPMPILRDWQRAGPAAVVLTRGADGLAVLTGDGVLVEVAPVPVDVVDTIGAGDTVQAALLAWLYRRQVFSAAAVRSLPAQAWRAALEWCASAAAITCSRAGAEPPYATELPPLSATE
jgi:fructokinase